MVKIKDIAERCGLSIASVSKALHGESDLNPETAKRIREIAAAADLEITREEWYRLYLAAGHILP